MMTALGQRQRWDNDKCTYDSGTVTFVNAGTTTAKNHAGTATYVYAGTPTALGQRQRWDNDKRQRWDNDSAGTSTNAQGHRLSVSQRIPRVHTIVML